MNFATDTAGNLVFDEEMAKQARACKFIINKNSGIKLERPPAEVQDQRWEIIWYRAHKHPEEFECKYEHSDEIDEFGNILWTREALNAIPSFPELRKIGKTFGVTSNERAVLVERILKAQEKEIGLRKSTK